ncbi:MAG: monofunctional biosynthetic peptidoglycan transglycosylase [Rhizobiaceae bacterium]|nr:monofunctional biosynthetic peptidoglycan transglycosylase [Rhizobiaceae bacterium]MCV0404619.1 monofunctional biosynthetic peptidoglycan transglycosylase [Rhizobiaceae bacterium]
MAQRKRRKPPPRARRWLGRIVMVLVLVALAPAILTLVYYPSFVHPVSTLMLKDVVTLKGYDRQWVGIDDVAPAVLHSVVMSEDGQFCSHHGVDLRELRAVIDEALAGEETRGASTITMQTAKNLYLWHGRSFLRKALEFPIAVYIDLILPKRRIMEIYINIAEWGPGIYGVEAASRHHFGKPASELNRQEAALLAVTLPNPIARNPARPTSGLRRLSGIIERRARQAGGYVGCLG